jgi:hypothetical protein
MNSVDSTGSTGSVYSMGELLEILRDWISKFIFVQDESDLDIIPLWIIHTHLATELYTSPRLLIDSPVPASGKTTLLEHIAQFAKAPVQMASVSSGAMLGRITKDGTRTLLIDEADRALDPKRPNVGDLIALLNSGYKRGSTRPVLVQKNKEWEIEEMPTFSPVAIAGNSPNIPEDTRSRCIVVRLLPDRENQARESDWEILELPAYQIKLDILASVETFREQIAEINPPLPRECVNRFKEKWKPLKRIAVLAGGDWAERVDKYILADIQNHKEQTENGDSKLSPHIQLMKDLYEIYGGERTFIGTETLVARLARHNPEYWGELSIFGKAITAQRFGRTLNSKFYLNSQRLGDSPRGYHSTQFERIWVSMGLPRLKPTEPTEPAKPTEPEEPNGIIW